MRLEDFSFSDYEIIKKQMPGLLCWMRPDLMQAAATREMARQARVQ
ncbi:unnamed protein product, partial [Heterosigma akashiwo]